MIGDDEAEAQRVVMWWLQDRSDYSWIATDPVGCVYRVSRVYDNTGNSRWGYCWRDGDYLRMGSRLFATSEECRSWIDLMLAHDTEERQAA